MSGILTSLIPIQVRARFSSFKGWCIEHLQYLDLIKNRMYVFINSPLHSLLSSLIDIAPLMFNLKKQFRTSSENCRPVTLDMQGKPRFLPSWKRIL